MQATLVSLYITAFDDGYPWYYVRKSIKATWSLILGSVNSIAWSSHSHL